MGKLTINGYFNSYVEFPEGMNMDDLSPKMAMSCIIGVNRQKYGFIHTYIHIYIYIYIYIHVQLMSPRKLAGKNQWWFANLWYSKNRGFSAKKRNLPIFQIPQLCYILKDTIHVLHYKQINIYIYLYAYIHVYYIYIYKYRYIYIYIYPYDIY